MNVTKQQKAEAAVVTHKTTGRKALKIGNVFIPAEVAGLACGKDAWMREIPFKCPDCMQKLPLKMIACNGICCEECSANSIEE